jgi:hypothetical protein
MRFYYSTYLKLNNYSEAKNENSKLKKKKKKSWWNGDERVGAVGLGMNLNKIFSRARSSLCNV